MNVTVTGRVMSSLEMQDMAGLGTSMEALPKLRSLSSFSASRSARLRLLFARAGRSMFCLALISMSAFALVRTFVLRDRGRNEVEAGSGGAATGTRALTWVDCGLLSLRGLKPRPAKSSLGSVSSMPWSEGLKFLRMRRHAARSSWSVWLSRTRRLIQGELSHMVSLEECRLWDEAGKGLVSGVILPARSCLEAVF